MKKPKILLITDVKGWGGWHRGKYIIEHLSDEFDISLIDQKTFNSGRYHEKDYDLYYFLFHILLRGKKFSLLRMNNKNICTVVTSKIILKKGWGKTDRERLAKWYEMTDGLSGVFVNNRITQPLLKNIYDGNIQYAPRGVDTQIFRPQEFPDEFTICYVGKPVPEKGLEKFIIPAAKRAGVKIIYNTNNFKNALTLDEMNTFYNRSSVYIVASVSDGTPNPALEAMACGRPVISNRIGNMPEAIENGHNGFLIKERNIDKYVKYINKLKNDKNLLVSMGQHAREKMVKEWAWEHILNTYERHAIRSTL